MAGERILIVEDDDAIVEGLALNLKFDGYEADTARDGETALDMIRAQPPALILLDIGLPGMSGLDVLSDLRGAGDHTPVIVLSARRDEFDKVAALRLGADDYVTKPFALAELLARVAAVLRRTGDRRMTVTTVTVVPAEPPPAPAPAAAAVSPPPVATPQELRFADVVVDIDKRTVERGGVEVKLTHLEFELLAHFLRHPTRVFSREQLLSKVWGMTAGSRRTVDNFVAQLRAKLEEDPDHPRYLVTVRGSGYRFDP